MVKIAILLCGHIRTWEKCKETFIKIFDKYDADIFIHTYYTQNGYHPYIKEVYNLQDDKKELLPQEFYKLFENLNIKDLCIENQEEIDKEIRENFKNPIKPFYDIIAQYRKILLCNNMRKEYEIKNNIKYDIIFKTRFDLMYDINFNFDDIFNQLLLSNIQSELIESVNDDNDIAIIDIGVYPSDMIIIGNHRSMDKIPEKMLSIYTDINEKDKYKQNDETINPHTLLEQMLRTNYNTYCLQTGITVCRK